MSGITQARHDLLRIFSSALAAVSGERCVADYLRRHPPGTTCHVVAIGKAASAMLHGAMPVLGEQVEQALLITKYGHADDVPSGANKVEVIEAGHPLPDSQSLHAGVRLLQFIEQTPEDCLLVFLISGGASALVEVLPAGIGLDALEQVNQWLLGAGLPIEVMNRVRKRLSCIKAGRLAGYTGYRRVLNLMISDVPDDDPKVIGSGLLIPHSEADLTLAGCELPGWLAVMLNKAPPLAKPEHFFSVQSLILANNRTACLAAAEAARQAGYPVFHHESIFEGDAQHLGEQMAEVLRRSGHGCHIWGGESTVRLPDKPGQGGRNQALALSAARILDGHDDCCLLSAGSDGTDGPTDDAGALVDGNTIVRGEMEHLNATDCLLRADSGRFLEASGDLVQTGPTGTNVMDLVIGIKI